MGIEDNAAFAKPFFALFEAGQSQWADLHKSYWDSGADKETQKEAGEANHWLSMLEQNSEAYQRQMIDWIQAASRMTAETSEAGENEELASAFKNYSAETTPFHFFYQAFGDALGQATSGPELADIGFIERKLLSQSKEWFDLQDATKNCQKIVSDAWFRAGQKLMESMASEPSILKMGPRDLVDRWLKLLNDELTQTQRSKSFLEAQRNLLRTATSYRIHHTSLVENWCEGNGIPTRSEVDELHQAVHSLRRELRNLKRQLSDAGNTPVKPEAKIRKKASYDKKPSNQKKAATKKASVVKKRRQKLLEVTAEWAPISAGSGR